MNSIIKELEQNKHRLELIRMARELLNEEYINRRAQDHNKWLAESDIAWKSKRIKLPYPAFTAYPTDEEIVAKASRLYKFVNSLAIKPEVDLEETQIVPTPEEKLAASKILPESTGEIPKSPWETYLTTDTQDKTAQVDLTETPDTANILETSTESPTQATLDTPESEKDVEKSTQINQTVSGIQNLLPGWVRRSANN